MVFLFNSRHSPQYSLKLTPLIPLTVPEISHMYLFPIVKPMVKQMLICILYSLTSLHTPLHKALFASGAHVIPKELFIILSKTSVKNLTGHL